MVTKTREHDIYDRLKTINEKLENLIEVAKYTVYTKESYINQEAEKLGQNLLYVVSLLDSQLIH